MAATPPTTGSQPNTDAGRYLKNVGQEWHRARTDLETKWNTNRDHFNRVFKKVFKDKDGEGWRSRAVPGWLRQKVTTGYALMIDLVLQNGHIPFAMKPSRRLLRQPGFAQENYADSVQRSQDRIADQFALCHADRAFMNNIMAAALYGRTWAKKTRGIFSESGWEPVPTPGVDDLHSVNPDTLSYQAYDSEYTGPAWEYVSGWEMFTDPEWENPRDPNSGGTFQERLVTPRWLRDKRRQAYYIPENIDLVIENVKKRQAERTQQATDSIPPYLRNVVDLKRCITYREWWCWMPREVAEKTEAALIALGKGKWEAPVVSETPDNDGGDAYVMVCTADDEVVRYARVNQREFPFFSTDWDKAVDEEMPNGVADNAEFAQNLLAGTLRMFINNKRLSGNVMHAINTAIFKNPPKEVEPGTTLHLKGSTDDLRKGWQQIITEDVGESLMSMIQLALQFGDDDTLIPKIAQGLDDEDKNKTAYEVSQQLARSDKYTGAVARNFDEYLIEPMATEFHRDNMEDPDIRDGQGDYVVEALGFQAVQDRIYRVAIYRQLLDLALSHPELARRAKIGHMLEHITRAMTVDPADFWTPEEELPEPTAGPTPEEQAAMQSEQQATAAKAEKDIADAEAKRMKAQTDAAKVELEAERMEREQAQAVRESGLATERA